MTFLFTCPHCGTQTEVDDRYAGQSGACAVCGKPITARQPQRNDQGGATGRAGSAEQRSWPTPLKVLAVCGILITAAAVIGVAMLLAQPAIRAARAAADRRRCADQLAQIAEALEAYHGLYGCFPPAYVADATGKPMYSWRVLLLPFLGERSLYERYDLKQPWNSPRNLALLGEMPNVYGCPGDPNARGYFETSYVVVTGRGTLFPGSASSTRSDVEDPSWQTVMVVEQERSGIGWTEPRDVNLATVPLAVNSGAAGVRSSHPGGAHVLTADGLVRFLKDGASASDLSALFTVRGGEPVATDIWDD